MAPQIPEPLDLFLTTQHLGKGLEEMAGNEKGAWEQRATEAPGFRAMPTCNTV